MVKEYGMLFRKFDTEQRKVLQLEVGMRIALDKENPSLLRASWCQRYGD